MSGENDYKKRFKSLAVSLQRTVECPVCLQTLKIPFKSCSRGHGVCLDCTSKLEKCPLCKEAFVLENLVCMKNMLEILPQLCSYTDSGCEEVVEPGNEHEMFCGFRPFVCPQYGCRKKMQINQIQAHIKKNHRDLFVFTRKYEDWKAKPWDNNTVYRTPVFLFNNLFWIVENADTKAEQLKILFVSTPIGKLDHDYYVQIKLEQGKFSYTHTLKAVLSCNGSGFDETTEVMKCTKEKYCMKVPLCELSRFKYGGRVRITYYFFKN